MPFLGETVIVVLDARATGAMLNTDAQSLPGVPRLTLHVGLPHTATPEQIRDAVQSWLQRQAKRVFEERVQHFARQARRALHAAVAVVGADALGQRVVPTGRSGSTGGWCTLRLSTIDYVVTHELAHLREMNHSPRFWDVVRSVLPDYERRSRQLKGRGRAGVRLSSAGQPAGRARPAVTFICWPK